MENLLDYQQVILNTIIKHCGADYTFKVGVRELGWRRRSTLNENEQLISPADYQRIDIEKVLDKEIFPEFARQICNARARSSEQCYYAGWQTLASMSHGNIRYMLQLVSQSRQYQYQKDKNVWDPIDAGTQTKAAEETGRKNLQELEGLSVHGAKLMMQLFDQRRLNYQIAI